MKNNLRTIRKARQIKIAVMSRLTGIKEGKLYELETEAAEPYLFQAYLLAKFFDLPVEDIWPNTVKVLEEPAVTYLRARPLRVVLQ